MLVQTWPQVGTCLVTRLVTRLVPLEYRARDVNSFTAHALRSLSYKTKEARSFFPSKEKKNATRNARS
ncbi:hypothetical protein SUGI_0143130 [Cryptomeria japonica]|nr:hypothetical protein SUGI_0143130 [Cryptomeria japonica]